MVVWVQLGRIRASGWCGCSWVMRVQLGDEGAAGWCGSCWVVWVQLGDVGASVCTMWVQQRDAAVFTRMRPVFTTVLRREAIVMQQQHYNPFSSSIPSMREAWKQQLPFNEKGSDCNAAAAVKQQQLMIAV